MGEASNRKQPPLPCDARPRSALEHRYGLYSAAHDACASHAGANALLRLYAQTRRCRRAAELIALAETQAENGFPKLGIEHLGASQGSCPDCVRSACLSAELAPASSEQPERLVAAPRPSAAAPPGPERARRAVAPRSRAVTTAILVAVLVGVAAVYAVSAT
jgi:hypothetical protein